MPPCRRRSCVAIYIYDLYRVHYRNTRNPRFGGDGGAKIPGRCLALLCSVFIVRQLRTNSPPCGEPRLSSFLGSPPLWTSTTVPPLPLPALRAVAHTSRLVHCVQARAGWPASGRRAPETNPPENRVQVHRTAAHRPAPGAPTSTAADPLTSPVRPKRPGETLPVRSPPASKRTLSCCLCRPPRASGRVRRLGRRGHQQRRLHRRHRFAQPTRRLRLPLVPARRLR